MSKSHRDPSNGRRRLLPPCMTSSRPQTTATRPVSVSIASGEAPSFCMVKRGGIVIMLAQVETDVPVRPNNLAPRGSCMGRLRLGRQRRCPAPTGLQRREGGA
jgi:hypothetical protein